MRRRYQSLVPHGRRPPPTTMPRGKALGEPETRVERLLRIIAEEKWHDALRIASRFTSLGEPADTEAVKRAWEAEARPAFARQLGKDPVALIRMGVDALRRWASRERATKS